MANEAQTAVLQQLNRPGWKIAGERPHTSKVQELNADNKMVDVEKPDGNIVWTIVGPNGQSDEVVVKPSTAATGFDTTQYSIVKGPQNNVQQPQAPAGWTDVKGITNSGVTTYYGRDPADGKFKQVPGLPSENQAKPTPTPFSGYQPIKDAGGRIVEYIDPNDPTKHLSVPQGAEKPADGAKRDTFDAGSNRAVHWRAQGGEWQISGIDPTPADPNKPVEGQSRQSVIPGTQYIGQETFHNGVWSIDSSFTPKPYVPNDKPKDGDVRPNTDPKGQAIQEVFRGGSWVTDTSVAPKPFGTQQPTTIATGTAPYIVQQTPEQAQRGETTNLPNPNTTDVAARVGQLQQSARTKRDQLQQAVSAGTKSPEDAASEFDTWWSANIDPFSQQLQRNQQQADYDAQTKQREQQRLEQEAQRAAYSTAQTAGQDAVKNITDTLPYRVGPGYGAAMGNVLNAFSTGKAPGPIDAEGLTYQMPDLNEVSRKATADALAHISPTAAAIAGRPMPQIPQSFDVSGALNKSQYTFSGKTTIAPDGTVTIDHSPQQPQIPAYVPNAGRTGGLDYALPPPTY